MYENIKPQKSHTQTHIRQSKYKIFTQVGIRTHKELVTAIKREKKEKKKVEMRKW